MMQPFGRGDAGTTRKSSGAPAAECRVSAPWDDLERASGRDPGKFGVSPRVLKSAQLDNRAAVCSANELSFRQGWNLPVSVCPGLCRAERREKLR
jgi:hypothetical protein